MADEPKKKKKFRKWLMIFAILFIIWLLIPTEEESEETLSDSEENVEQEVAYNENEPEEIYDNEQETDTNSEQTTYGDGTATIMIYMVGSDLEAQGGCATTDIYEICNANIGSNVNIVIQTGGASTWHNEWVSEDSVQRFLVEEGELVLKDDIGLVSMVEQDTLSDFISWGTENYPADRMGLIMWNHGGGSIVGFGYDEYFEGELDLTEMGEALNTAGTHFDFVGFDACLMATIETAYMLSPYADYMIASEETEPGTGWYYTEWLELLGQNPLVSMETLGQKLVDDYINGPDSSFWYDTTLTVLDLQKIPELYQTLCTYMAQGRVELTNNAYSQISYARSGAKAYGDGEYEQIDIVDYVELAQLDGGDEVIAALEEAIVYHDATISNTNGLAMYFPYDYPGYYQNMLQQLDEIGMEDDSYQGFFNDFINILVYGQYQNTRAMSPMEKLTGYTDQEQTTDYTDTSWYQEEIGEQYFEATTLETLETGELYLTEKGDNYVLQLTEEQWETITYIDMWVYMDDGGGYIDLGNDNVYEFDEDGDLLIDFDYTWVALDGQIVPFYAQEEGEKADGSWYTYGCVPAELTLASDGSKQDVEILIYWDDAHDGGYVTGYRLPSASELNVAERNIMQLEDGDMLDFFCDYYTYDGEYEASYYFGDTLTVNGTLTVSYEELEENPTDVCFYLKDIYRNEYWTETITFYFE